MSTYRNLFVVLVLGLLFFNNRGRQEVKANSTIINTSIELHSLHAAMTQTDEDFKLKVGDLLQCGQTDAECL